LLSQPRKWSHLVGVSFAIGDPGGLEYTIPEVKRQKEEALSIFQFGQTRRDVWMVCSYDSTRIAVSRSIGRPFKCTVSRKHLDGEIAVRCQQGSR
jgi:hypothetical protein